MSDPIPTVIQLGDDLSEITVWTGADRVFIQVDTEDGFTLVGVDVEAVDALIRALAAARVEIAPPTTHEKPVRNPRQPNVPDNADALARVAKSKPERIDGDEK